MKNKMKIKAYFDPVDREKYSHLIEKLSGQIGLMGKFGPFEFNFCYIIDNIGYYDTDDIKFGDPNPITETDLNIIDET